MIDVDYLLRCLIDSSLQLSKGGSAELSAHQEAAIQALGFFKINGGELKAVDEASMSFDREMVAIASDSVLSSFRDGDVQVAMNASGDKGVILYAVESEQLFDGVPIFWQNYLAQGMFPSVLMIFLERIYYGVDDEISNISALPYFVILNCSGDSVTPMLAMVGQELREQAIESAEKAFEDGYSNVAAFFPIAVSLLLASEPRNE